MKLSTALVLIALIGACTTPVTETLRIESTSQAVQKATEQPVVTSAPATQPTTAGYIPSCNWEKDWQSQSDGFYLWVGLPAATPACQNIAKAQKR